MWVIKVQKTCSWLECTLCREWYLWCKYEESSLVMISTRSQLDEVAWYTVRPTLCFQAGFRPSARACLPQPLLQRILLGRPWWRLTENPGLHDPAPARFSHFTSQSSPGVPFVLAVSLLVHFPCPHPNWHDWMLHNYLIIYHLEQPFITIHSFLPTNVKIRKWKGND